MNHNHKPLRLAFELIIAAGIGLLSSCSDSNEETSDNNFDKIMLSSMELSNDNFSVKLDFIYDDLNRLGELIYNNRGVESTYFIEYDNLSRIKLIKTAIDTLLTTEYNSENSLSSVLFKESQDEKELYTFKYDIDDNIVEIITTNFFSETASAPTSNFLSYDDHHNIIELLSSEKETSSLATYDAVKNPLHYLNIPNFISYVVFGIDYESTLSANNLTTLNDLSSKVFYTYEYKYQNDLPVEVRVKYEDSFDADNIINSEYFVNYTYLEN